MVAMSVFTIMALGTLAAMIQSRKMSDNNVAQAEAVVIAQGIIEQVQLAGYTNVASDPAIPLKFAAISSTNVSTMQTLALAWAPDAVTFSNIGAVDAANNVLGVVLDLNYMNGASVIRPARYMKMKVNLQRIPSAVNDNIEILLTYSWQPPTANGQANARYITREFRTIRSQTPSY